MCEDREDQRVLAGKVAGHRIRDVGLDRCPVKNVKAGQLAD